jgi:hypothetical protein
LRASRVEERRGAANGPFPLPAHQTGRADFPHPAFRLVSSRAYGGPSAPASSVPNASPWLRDAAFSEGSWHYAVLYRLAPSHPPSPSSTSAPEVRVLPSTGITRPQQYYDPVRLPHRPAPCSTVEAATLAICGSPPITWLTVSTCGAHYPGGPAQVHLSAASQDRAAFPELRAGRRPQLPFRGLLRLHSRYRPSICSTARGGLCRRASIQPVARPNRLPATGPTDRYPDETFTH